MVEDGRVRLNGKVITALGTDVKDGDVVELDGRRVTLTFKKVYVMLNKPKGCVCTVSDEKGRKTVLDFVKLKERIFPVGRLDYDSEGLLILTTDGELAQHLTHPSNSVPKTYLVKIEGTITESALNPIRSGIEIDGYVTKKCKAHIVETNKEFTKIHITVTEGKTAK